MAALRDDIADLAARLDDGEATAELLPHRRKYLMLVIDFLRKYLDLHLELVDEVEREFAAEPERSATSSPWEASSTGPARGRCSSADGS